MAKKKRRPPVRQPDSRPAETLTVGWMLSVTTTLVCALMAAMIWLVVRGQASNELPMLLVRYLHFSSIVTGLISLGLLVAVLKLRSEPPPRSIVVAAVIIAVLPIAAAIF